MNEKILEITDNVNAGEIVVQNISKVYGIEGSFEEKRVINDCSLIAPKEKLSVIIGPSGCGKSTLLKLIAGFEKPTTGRITIDGIEVTKPGFDRLLLFQETALFPWMNIHENIVFGPKSRGDVSSKKLLDQAEFLLVKMGLQGFKDKYPIQLSGGMQRRAELARALINNPSVTLLDEPFRGLDAMTRELMQKYYLEIFEEFKGTNIFITTDLDEAIYLADYLLIMENIPTRVRKVISVNLPRPRPDINEMLNDVNSINLKQEALELLHEEAIKSFSHGSIAASDFVEACSRTAGKRI